VEQRTHQIPGTNQQMFQDTTTASSGNVLIYE
jgi:hypothetical protein